MSDEQNRIKASTEDDALEERISAHPVGNPGGLAAAIDELDTLSESHNVPANSVEAGAMAAFGISNDVSDWRKVPASVRRRHREDAAVILQAAAPYMKDR